SVGRMLQVLEELGQLDNTVVIYTSDNGYFVGEHRRGDKRLASEESIRIPLLMRYPRLIRAGSRPRQMALNIDLAPTILDLAGVEIPDGVQGRSLRPVLQGRANNWRRSWLYEYFREGWLPGVPTMLAVRTERWKYITYPDIHDLDELYDLQADPHEMTNLALKPEYRDQLEVMKQELQRLRKETGYDKPPKLMLPKTSTKPVPVLVMTFDQDKGAQAVDSSGKHNDGQASGAPLVTGRDGKGKARRFDGQGSLQVPRSPSLDPSMKPFTVSAVVKPEKPDGVIVARGGQSHGFALYLQEGKPAFALRSSGEMFLVAAPDQLPEGWVELTAMLTHDLRMVLYVNGKKVAEGKADWLIVADPNEGLDIGADRDTRVGPYEKDNGFVGLIDEVRIYTGEKPPQG
ncbi:MAG: DUF4976 domain-containing protein, partial [Armatimonadetes bacterium]|nr:DUF4976 domain-containing protein [Armatimonadota bacterium]